MKPTVVIIGAGSVEFTRELLGDILSFPELGSVRVVLHDIDDERLETAEAIARATARAAGAEPEVVATSDRRRALDGANYVINVIAVGMHEATVRDFEIPARYGLNQTIADTIGVGGIFRGLRTFPVLAGIARDMAEVCPDAWLLNYTNPMAMNVTFLHRVAPAAEGAGAVPLRLLDDGRPVRAHRRALRGGVVLVGGREPPGVGVAMGARRREPLPAAGPAHRRRPGTAQAGARRHVPAAGLLPDRDQRAQQRVRAVVSASPRRDRAAADQRRRVRLDQRGQRGRIPPPTSRIGGYAVAADRHRIHGVRAPGDPLPGDRDAAGHLRQRGQRRADHQPARRGGRRSADTAGRPWRAPDEGRRPATAVRGVEPELPRPGGSGRARRRRGRSAAGARGGHGRPEHRGDADRRPDRRTVRRVDRRAR